MPRKADIRSAFMLGIPAQSGADEKPIEARIRDNVLRRRDGKSLTEIAPQLG